MDRKRERRMLSAPAAQASTTRANYIALDLHSLERASEREIQQSLQGWLMQSH